MLPFPAVSVSPDGAQLVPLLASPCGAQVEPRYRSRYGCRPLTSTQPFLGLSDMRHHMVLVFDRVFFNLRGRHKVFLHSTYRTTFLIIHMRHYHIGTPPPPRWVPSKLGSLSWSQLPPHLGPTRIYQQTRSCWLQARELKKSPTRIIRVYGLFS